MKDTQQEAKVRRTVRRLTIETRNMRGVFAAWRSWRAWSHAGGATSNMVLQGALVALQSDLMIRLIRVLDRGSDTASFWYLHRSGLRGVEEGIDMKFLRVFSMKLTTIRNKVFVHIDKDGVFAPEKYYGEAGITDRDIARAIEQVRTVLSRIRSGYGETAGSFDNQSLDSLCQDFKRDFLQLVGDCSRRKA
jgi:hypothetical protein